MANEINSDTTEAGKGGPAKSTAGMSTAGTSTVGTSSPGTSTSGISGSATMSGTPGLSKPSGTAGTSAPIAADVDFTSSTTDDVDFKPAPALATGGDGPETKRTAKDTIKAEASKLQTQAADRARSVAGDGKTRATGALDEFARMMEEAADSVEDRLGAQYGDYARSAAGYVSGFADTLRNKEVDELVGDARDFVRQSPMVAIGTAAALGFVLARVVKAGIDGVADAADRTPPRA